MKICWDNLEKLTYDPKKGFFRDKGRNVYYEQDSCIGCKEPFLGTKDSEFCTNKCGYTSERTKNKHKELSKGEKNGMYNKKHSPSAIKKMQSARKKAQNLPEKKS